MQISIFKKYVYIFIFGTLFYGSVFASEKQTVRPELPSMPSSLIGLKKYGFFSYFPSDPETLYLINQEITFDYRLIDFQRIIKRLNIKNLVLWSPGGSIERALELSYAINNLGISTYIPKYTECSSACSFLFLAGNPRYSSGKLGVHQFYIPDDALVSRKETMEKTLKRSAEINDALFAFDAPNEIITAMGDTPPNSMYYFEKESLNKINTGASSNFEVQESLLADRDSYYLALDKYKADLLAFEKHQEKVKEKKKQEATNEPVITKNSVEKTEKTKLTSVITIDEKAPLIVKTKPTERLPENNPKADPNVMELQRLLNRHLCDAGVEDGFMGAKTQSALRRIQERLEFSGKVESQNDIQSLIIRLKSIGLKACTESEALNLAQSERLLLIQCQNSLARTARISELELTTSSYIHSNFKGLMNYGNYDAEVKVRTSKSQFHLDVSAHPIVSKIAESISGLIDVSDEYIESTTANCVYKVYKLYD